jgi:hypothetical protein
MIFVYPYKRKDSDFLIQHSIKLVRKHFKNAGIYTVGDKVEGVDHIEHKDSFERRGCNVTSKILHASTIFDEFVYMNDDFFINDRFDFDCIYRGTEQLERKEGKASIAWNQAVDNSKHFLEVSGFTFFTYECHQPVIFNSELLQHTFHQINWKNADHFLKSLYFNMNPPKKIKPIENVKLIEPHINKADLYLTMYGCFSVGQGFLTEKGANYIKKLI